VARVSRGLLPIDPPSCPLWDGTCESNLRLAGPHQCPSSRRQRAHLPGPLPHPPLSVLHLRLQPTVPPFRSSLPTALVVATAKVAVVIIIPIVTFFFVSQPESPSVWTIGAFSQPYRPSYLQVRASSNANHCLPFSSLPPPPNLPDRAHCSRLGSICYEIHRFCQF
jgi:hypothetical protein